MTKVVIGDGPFAHRVDQLARFENGRIPIFLLESEYNRAQLCWQQHDALVEVLSEILSDGVHSDVVPHLHRKAAAVLAACKKGAQ